LDGNILSYYDGVYESVFILLHPFINPVSISKEVFKPDTYPDTLTIAKECDGVSWSEIMTLTGLPSFSAIDIGLRTRIGGLKKTLASEEFANAVDALYDINGIIPPYEGGFSDLMHNRALKGFQQLGHQWAWVGDEFGTQRKLYWIEDLMVKEIAATSGHCNVFSPDKSLLWTTHWDSHFSFLCGSHKALASLVQSMSFDGFFCDKDTEVYWSVHSNK
jgi:hypothetical protein